MSKFSMIILMLVICSIANSAELTDPTRPFGYQASQLSPVEGQTENYLPLRIGLDPNQFKLHGIIAAKSGNSAMLNGRRVRVGDAVLGSTVTEIKPTHVLLEGNGDSLRLELLSLKVKYAPQRTAGEER